MPAIPGSQRDALISVVGANFRFRRGYPLPLGATLQRDGINFAIFSKHATWVRLLLFHPENAEAIIEFPLDPHFNRTGDIWHAFIGGIDPGVHYGYRMDCDPNPNPKMLRYDPEHILLDPYARALSGGEEWGATPSVTQNRRCIVVDNRFEWQADQPLNRPLADSVIYELHVRGFTRHPSSGVGHPGTFTGLAEKIPYLQRLGVTAVELLPVNEFEESDTDRNNPFTGEPLLNFWGYQSINFFSANAAFAADPWHGEVVREFKTMVRDFHAAGIEVILDVVFNHTAEGNEKGFTWSFRGIDNPTYYMIEKPDGEYLNYSGCGNTFNCNHPVVREMIVDCLRYWVMEMHVDGFRFDLAAILGRGQDGTVLKNPPLLEALAHDPVLANTKLIAEAWDAGGLYQVGTFPAWSRWAEWNGKYRDEMRRFIKGDPGLTSAVATRLCGSPDLYETSERAPYHSINFATCHDGFTLGDLFAYNEKHNLANGENNTDGGNENHSWNCGAEGATPDPAINALRLRLQKNHAVILMCAQGVPMITAGDELGRTQNGNNNAYCQDNEVSWIDWRLAETNAGLLRFFQRLIAFRAANELLRGRTFLSHISEDGVHVQWHGVHRGNPDWGVDSRILAMQLVLVRGDIRKDIHLIANMHWERHDFELPVLSPVAGEHRTWRRLLDTSLPSPDDIADSDAEATLLDQDRYAVAPRTVVVVVA